MSKPFTVFAEGKDPDIYVALRVADLMQLRPDWAERDAAEFLQICADHLAELMLLAGTSELARLLLAAEKLPAKDQGAGDA